jgi:PAS domain S-box-containing protein
VRVSKNLTPASPSANNIYDSQNGDDHLEKSDLSSKFILTSIFFFFFFISLLSKGSAEAKVATNNRITVATLRDSSLFSFIDKHTGKPSGFFIEFMNEIAKRGGFSVSYKFEEDWKNLLSAVQNGEADLALGLAVTEERKQFLAFTWPIDTTTVSSFVRASNYSDDPLDKAKRVGIRKGSYTGRIIQKNHPNIAIEEYESYSEGLFDLLAGHIDAFCASTSVITQLSKESGIEDKIKIAGKPIDEFKSAVGMQKSNTELLNKLNKIIDEYIHTAEYRHLYTKWHATPTPYWTGKRILIVSAVMGIIMIMVMTGWRYYSLSHLNKSLVELEQNFRTLFDQSADAIILFAPSGRIVDVNKVAIDRYKYSREEFIGMDIGQLYSPENIHDVTGKIETLIKKERLSFEGQHITKDGIVIPTEVNARVVEMNGGHLSISTCRDITERKNAEKTLAREIAFQSAIGEVSEAFISPGTDISTLSKVVLHKALSLTGSAYGYVSEVDRTTGSSLAYTLTEMMDEQCSVTGENQRIAFPKGPSGYNALWGHSLNSFEAFYTNSPQTHSAFKGCYPSGHVPVERFLSVPAISSGRLIGQIALANPKAEYTEDDLNITKRLASIYAIGVDRKRMEADLRQSIIEKETLLKEIHHRVKNNMAVVSSLLNLAAYNIKDPTIRQQFEESQQRVKSMALVHEKLYHTKNLSAINFKDYITTILEEIIALHSEYRNRIIPDINIADIELDLDSAVPCGLILNELLMNVCKHAFPGSMEGLLHIEFVKTGDTYTLTVKDNGVGLPEGFDYSKNETLGLEIVNALSRQLNGNFQIKSNNGTEAVLTFTKGV